MEPPWLGQRHAVFVPVVDSHVDLSPPDDFAGQVFERVFFDPDPATHVDRSLQRYISEVSYGKASLAASVTDVVVSNTPDTMGAARRSIPESNDYDVVVAVLLSSGPDRGGWAWLNDPEPISGIDDFARVNLQEGLGTWAMEVMHCLTGFMDLYNTTPNLGQFDNMACNCGTHPSVHTKVYMKWLPESAVALKTSFGQETFVLHPVGLSQPRPRGRRMAVRIPARGGGTYFMVEARIRSDAYETRSYASEGIPSEGVIVYEVADKLEVYLRTPDALRVNNTFSVDGIDIKVVGHRYGDFRVAINIHLGSNDRQVPYVRFVPRQLADKRIRDAELVPKFKEPPGGGGTYVFSQSPAGGTIVDVGDTVTMQLRKGPTP